MDVDADITFIGKEALTRIRDEGITRKQVGLVIDGERLRGPNTVFWSVVKDGETIGKVTSAVYSPRLDQNIALALVSAEHAVLDDTVTVMVRDVPVSARIVDRPFYDPKKSIAQAQVA